jgi:hypothetical protein
MPIHLAVGLQSIPGRFRPGDYDVQLKFCKIQLAIFDIILLDKVSIPKDMRHYVSFSFGALLIICMPLMVSFHTGD